MMWRRSPPIWMSCWLRPVSIALPVIGYWHGGGAVAQTLAYTRPAIVSRLIFDVRLRLQCVDVQRATSTPRVFRAPASLQPRYARKGHREAIGTEASGAIGLTRERAEWLRSTHGTLSISLMLA